MNNLDRVELNNTYQVIGGSVLLERRESQNGAYNAGNVLEFALVKAWDDIRYTITPENLLELRDFLNEHADELVERRLDIDGNVN